MEESRKDDEDRAWAFAGLSLVKAVIDALAQKGVLDEGEIQEIFERALTSLEFRAQDGATRLARRIVEGAAIARVSQQPKNPAAPDGSRASD